MRIQPGLPAADYKTYQLLAPRPTHRRSASCQEVRCAPFVNGWVTRVPAGSDLEQLVRRSGRKWLSVTTEGGEVVFTFPAGTACFKASTHTVSLDRPPLYIVRDGDWRGNPRGTEPRIHAHPEDWVDDFATHQDRLSRLIERG